MTPAVAVPIKTHGKSRWLWAAAGFAGIVALAIVSWLRSPLPPPRVTATTQITHDGIQKFTILTDGSRVYVNEGVGGANVLVQVSATGGDTSVIPTASANLFADDISPDRSQLLSSGGQGTVLDSQFWILPLPTGAPRRLAE